jgi:two-component system OmpR family sensor kinase/two-component system sensor histidine kinase BaeS
MTRRAGWKRGRARFMRRIALAFAALLFLSALGAGTLISMLFGGRSLAATSAPIALTILAGLFLAALLAVTMRRVGGPLGDVVEAANQLASGDYTARVVEHGPPSLRTVGHAFNGMAARLESQDRQRRQLMADIAHELRTPLSVVQGRIEGLLDGVYPRDDAQLGQALAETRMLARLVDDLRTLAHAESGTLTLQKEPSDVTILAQEVVDTFSPEANSRKVSLRLDTPRDLPLASVDPLRLREILMNLLSNALHHTPANGRIAIELSAVKGRIVVTVADTGVGIAAEDLPKIFDRFYKGSTSRGSGLGLAIARNLVAAHGGDIKAESQPGHGTTITFSLPT